MTKYQLLPGWVYKSPSRSLPNNAKLCDLLQMTENYSYSYILIGGDFNYSDIDWNTSN